MSKILIVDDEPDLQPLMQQQFRRKIRSGDYEFFFALNGLDALDVLKENPDIDVVITDINMPEMDGLTFLEKLNKHDPNLKAIVVSAYGDMQNIRTAMNRGAFDFVTKPVNFDDLETTVHRTIEHREMLIAALDARAKFIAISQELDVASRLQQAILPKEFPNVETAKMHALMQPATEVAGDFYDFFWLDDNRLGIVMADVSGKGVTASLFMMVSRTLLKAIAPYCKGPGECLTKVNKELCHENETAMFVTTFYGIFNIQDGSFTYANGGHCPPVLLDATGQVRFLPLTQGIALGVFEEANFAEQTHQMAPAQSMFLYTDGVSEAMSEQNEEYGNDRLLDAVKHGCDLAPAPLIEHIMLDIKKFTGTAPQSDDITCLTFKYR